MFILSILSKSSNLCNNLCEVYYWTLDFNITIDENLINHQLKITVLTNLFFRVFLNQLK